jgi:hypothetical protein
VDADELRVAYEHFELTTPDLDALIAARQHSAEVEAAVAKMWAEHDLDWETNPRHDEMKERIRKARDERTPQVEADKAPVTGWIPPEWWGDWIWLSRRHYRPRVSQARLADEISAVIKCSARDVARLERLRNAPSAPVDLQRCLAFVAVMQLDPVWAETHKGLAAGPTSLELDALEPVASEWVAEVRHLNQLLRTRPHRWEAQGDR